MKKTALLLLALLVAGCSEPRAPNKVGSFSGGEAVVEEHVLSDGTRCAVMVGLYKGGITCDWR